VGEPIREGSFQAGKGGMSGFWGTWSGRDGIPAQKKGPERAGNQGEK